jgi:hypothetical protein
VCMCGVEHGSQICMKRHVMLGLHSGCLIIPRPLPCPALQVADMIFLGRIVVFCPYTVDTCSKLLKRFSVSVYLRY